MQSSHSATLTMKHAGIDERLQREQNRPAPDDMVIKKLKREKLRIKEELARL
ncbi:YdcH family protein [Qipengyuania atrilutea]|uniref:DUF465 domain-containing protein n=1 Tax=Qipengyuania atrilutea TaxID=2744473 RepID=A0A850H454_9SPHN|nr:DUF465 domain-containing protein [Actirhodobacter atriluteus]NVD44972.1 DUF465 domain-containing protein [Actirhodobacter atriluteus]